MNLNKYWRQLTPEEIDGGAHRRMVGGMWDEIGKLQFDFMVDRGLRPHHTLLDMGCGPLRGGLHFIDYLDTGNYYGIDINRSLIAAAEIELRHAGLADKHPKLAVSDDFGAGQFGVHFDFGIAQSLFTHLPRDHIERCLRRIAPVVAGTFFATYFEAPENNHKADLEHTPGGVTTHYDSDPFHLSFPELAETAGRAGMSARRIGPWNHPRAQHMATFEPL